MKGRAFANFRSESVNSRKFPARRLLVPFVLAIFFLATLLVVVTVFSQNAEAAFGLSVSVQPPKDRFMENTTNPQSVTFIIEITNTGTSEESVNLTFTFLDPAKPVAGWTVNPVEISVNNIGAGAIETIQVVVTAPNNESAYSFAQLSVYGYVKEDPTVNSIDSFIARVSPIYGISVDIEDGINFKTTDQGANVTFNLIVNNTGNVEDTIDLSAVGLPFGWVAVFTPSSQTITAGGSFSCTMTLTLPSLVESKVYPVIALAASQNDPSETDSVSTFTSVNPEYLLSVSVTPSTIQDGFPGDVIQYTLTVENLGNTEDQVNISIENLEGLTWITSLDKGNHNISFQSSETWTLYVEIPERAKDWERGKVMFTAYSAIDLSAISEIITTTRVEKVYAIDVYISDPTITTDPGLLVFYSVEITNIGNTNDTIDLVTSGVFISYVSPNTIFDLAPGSTQIVSMEVIVPSDALAGLHYNTITATSEDTVTTENETVTTEVNPVYDVTLLPVGAASKEGEPGGAFVTYQLRVRNDGNEEDTIALTLEGDKPSWAGLDRYLVTVPAKGYTTVNMSVAVPAGEPMANWNIIVNGTSSGDPNEWDIVVFEIRVTQMYDVSLSTTDNSNSVAPGNSTVYYISVKNTGTAYDDYTATTWAEEPMAITWSVISPPSFGLAPGDNITIILTVTVPAGASPGNYNIWVNVTSVNQSAVTKSLLTITNVFSIYSFELSTTAPNNTKQGEPGDAVAFALRITNTGSTMDSYEFLVSMVDDTIFFMPDPNAINNLDVGNVGTSQATITITSDNSVALAGFYQIEIRANSHGDPTVVQYITLVVEITAVGDIDIDPPSLVDTGEPGDIIDYTFRIINHGNAMDTFHLDLQGSNKDWGEIIDFAGFPITNITLTANGIPGFFSEIRIRVTIPTLPGAANAGQSYPITLKVTSSNTIGVSITAQCSTTVEDFVYLELEYVGNGSAVKDYDPNKATPQFPFKVTNYGNMAEDGIEIRIDFLPPAWDYTPSMVSDTLDPGESSNFNLDLTIPSDESFGSYYLSLYVVSSVDPSVESDVVLVTINIVKPDLSISISDISGLSDIPYLKGKVGESTTITVRIHNIGQSRADSVEVKLFEDMILRDTQTVTSIEPGGYYDVAFSWLVFAESVELKVEITQQIELDLSNNEIPPIFLDLRPDISFTSDMISFSNSNPETDETITISAFVTNSGGDAQNVQITFYNSSEIIGNKSFNLDYNEFKEAIITWQVAGEMGSILTIRAEIYLPGAKGDGDSTIKLLNVSGEQVITHAPVLDAIPHLVAYEDALFSYTVTASDEDAMDTLTFFDDSDLIEIDSATGEISFTPTNDDVGLHIFNVTVMDSNSTSDSQMVVLSVVNVNDPPTLKEIENQNLTEDSQFTLTISASDIDMGDSLSFSDDTLLFDINPLTGVISFTPRNEDVGTYKVNITVRDESGAVDYQEVLFTVFNVNDLPIIEPVDDQTLLQDSPFTYTVSASDVDDGDTLTFSDDTELFDVNPDTGEISYTPSKEDVGTHDVTITVTDFEGGTDQTQVSITVLEKPEEPSEDPGDFWWILWILIAGLIAFLAGFFLRRREEEEPSMEEEVQDENFTEEEPELDSDPEESFEFEVEEEDE